MTTTDADRTALSTAEAPDGEETATDEQHRTGHEALLDEGAVTGAPELAVGDGPPRRGWWTWLRTSAASHPVVIGSLAGVVAVGGAFGAGFVVGQDVGAASSVSSVTTGVTDQLGPGGGAGDLGVPPDMGERPDRGTGPDLGTGTGTGTDTDTDDGTTDPGVTDGSTGSGA